MDTQQIPAPESQQVTPMEPAALAAPVMPAAQPAAPVATAPKPRKKPMLAIILVVLLVLVTAASGYLYTSLQSTKKDLSDAQAQLATKNAELQKAMLAVAGLRDNTRKRDLTLFAQVIRSYNSKNKTHLTTEGTISKNIYKTELSTAIDAFKDPKTEQMYDFVGVAKVQSPPPLAVGTLQYQWPGKCGETTLEDTNDEASSAVATQLENGSMYCLQI